jgi:polysaccharide export outer membrane protein
MRAIITLALSLAIAAVLLVATAADPVHEYVIGPDDVLDIIVTNHEELNKTVTVLEDGTITLDEVGTITASGKSPRELAALIKTSLSKTRKKVEVLISPKEIHSRNVRILGAVKLPGVFTLKSDWRLMDLIDSAGGLTQKPSRVTGRLVRNRSQIVPVNLEKADTQRDSEFNVRLMRDDEVVLDEVDAKAPQVIVMGSVGKPGIYELDDQATALSLITLAGGPTEKAELTRSYVTRDAKQLPLNLISIQQGKLDPAIASFKFQPGDVLFIPESQVHFAVMGQVAKPGFYPMPETGVVTVLDALNLVGGSAGGSLSKAGVIRTVNAKPTVIKINIDYMLKKGDLSQNIPLQANDVLYIPANSSKSFNWTNVLSPISILAILGFHL